MGEKETRAEEVHRIGGSQGFGPFFGLLMLSDGCVTVVLAGSDPSIW